MEDYRLSQTGQEVQDILNGAAMQVDLNTEVERATDAEGTLQGNIDAEEQARQDADGLLQQGISDEETRAKRAEEANAGEIEGIKALIPATASEANKLADTNYVNSSIQTATAEYRGDYNVVTDLHLSIDATHAQIETLLPTVIAEADKNDYCYVMIPTSAETPTEIAKIERYKMTSEGWKFEYDVNNSTFTAEEWAAIKSGITSGLVGKLNALPTNADLLLLLAGKQDVLTFDATPVQSSNNPVKSGGVYSAIDDEKTARLNSDTAIHTELDGLQAKVPATASSDNKLVDQNQMNSSISTATATFRGDWNVVSDLHLAVDATREQIAAMLPTVIATADNNDYCYVEIPTSAETPTQIERVERYKFNGMAWAFEYVLNNSGFTAAQWAAINSMITSGLVAKLTALPTNTDLIAMFSQKQDVLTFDSTPTENSTNPVTSGGVFAADKTLSDAIEAILLLIPSAASSLNKLVDLAQMNSSISTATATFRGTYNLVSDLGLGIDATEGEIAAALLANISTADNNDYAFVQIPTSAETPAQIARTDRYKFNGTAWAFEYTLNTSGFTAAQWAAINSTITSALVAKLNALPTAAELQESLGILTSGITAINQKIPSTASQSNKLVDNASMENYIAQVINILDASFNVTSTDGHITLHITQVDGVITSVQVQSTDIASAADLALKASQADLTAIASRVTTAEGNITSLTGRMGTAETNIANLQQLYNDLQQSKPVPVTALPSTGQQQGVIYRLAGTTSYSDYMWDGSLWVLMATYNNAIDPRPKKASQNLVTSGGVFDNIGALDVSELNATENPHTLAQYADLSAALAAIPTDYQKGGMSIKFVQSSDNKYVQYFLTKNTWSASEADWEKMNLEEEIYGITNIQSTNVKLYSVISENFAIVQNGNGADVYSCPVEEGKRYKVNFYPIFSSNNTGTYIWVFTNTANKIDTTTEIAHSELYTEHFSGPTTEIELVAPQFAKTLYVLSSRTPMITEYRDLAGNTTDSLNSFASGNALSANAGRQAAYIANQKGLSLGLKHICNGEPITHIDISNIGENKWIKEKNFAKNYFLYSLTDTSNVWFSTPEYHPTGRNLIHIKFRLEIERTGGATNTLTIYISDGTAPGGIHYHTVTTIGDDGYFDLVFDPSHYIVYEQWEHFYIWFWMNGAVSASQKVSFKFYDLQIVEYDEKTSFANINGETAKDLFESTDAKLTEIDSKTNDSIPTLIAPNGAKYVMAIDNNGNISPIPVIPNKATIFGNSLVSGFSYVEGDSFGMCASAPNKAFKSLFYDYISSVNPSFVGVKYGAAPFETISGVSQIDYAINAYFLPALVGDEDLVIIELGDNVSVANEPVFAQSSVALLQAIRAKCPNARVVWLGIWYGSETKYNIVKNACEVVGCEFITLSELVTSENMGAIGNVIEQGLDDRTISDVSNVIENTATNITIEFTAGGAARTATMDVVSYSLNGTTLSYRGLYSVVVSGGVASHPGDRGMKAIANKLLYKLGIVNDTEYYSL